MNDAGARDAETDAASGGRSRGRRRPRRLYGGGRRRVDHDDRESNVEATVGAVDYLRSEVGVETVVLVGASAGANAVVKTDANTDVDVAGSFILAPGRAGDLGAGLSGRKLFVVGEGDSDRFVETTKRLHGDASEPKELVVLDAAEHAQGIFETSAGDRLQSLLVEFVNTVCPEP